MEQKISHNKEEYRKHALQLASKFLQNSHFLEPQYKSYENFLDFDMAEFLTEKRYLIGSIYSEETKTRDQCYIVIDKIKHEPLPHYEVNRSQRFLSNEQAIIRKASRLLKTTVNVELYCENEQGERTVLAPSASYLLCHIPLLSGSKYDPLRSKSHEFILNGTPRVLAVSYEPTADMVTFSDNSSKTETIAKKFGKHNLYQGYVALKLGEKKARLAFTPFTAKDIQLFSILRYLEVKGEDLLEAIYPENPEIKLFLLNLMQYAYSLTPSQINDYLVTNLVGSSSGGLERLQYIMKNYLLGTAQEYDKNWKHTKGKTLIKLLKETIAIRKKLEEPTFPESFANKKFTEPGNHLHNAFKDGFQSMIEKARLAFPKVLSRIKRTKNLLGLIDSTRISSKLQKLVIASTADRSLEQIAESNSSIVNELERLDKFRKVITQLNKDMGHQEVRSLNPTKIGRTCLLNTPHSKAVGLNECLSLGAKISRNIPKEKINQLIKIIIEENEGQRDGLLVLDDKEITAINVNSARRSAILNRNSFCYELGIYCSTNKLELVTSRGRLLKPVANVRQGIIPLIGNTHLSLQQLIEKSFISYLDVTEQRLSRVVPEVEYISAITEYVQLPLELYLSQLALMIPLQNANAAVRSSLTLKFLKQGLGRLTETKRTLSLSNNVKEFLLNADYGLVRTPFTTLVPDVIGQTALVAMLSIQGATTEDALVVSKSAVDRGFLSYLVLRNSYSQYPPDNDSLLHSVNPRLEGDTNFDNRGIIKLNAEVRKGDSIANLFALTKFDTRKDLALLDKPSYVDYSKRSSSYTNAKVDSVLLLKDEESSNGVRVGLKELRKLDIGEKLTSLSGQKGVISKLIDDYNLPLCSPGYVAAVYISTHVITQRMTLAPLVQLLLAKVAALQCKPLVMSSFDQFSTHEAHAKKILLQKGLDENGRDLCLVNHNQWKLINTGFMKLVLVCHHSWDKHYHRRKGKVQVLTKQPVQGKSINGGLRFGEMQKGVALEHCAHNFLEDRLTYDRVDVLICTKCNVLVDVMKGKSSICHSCGATENIADSPLYAMKLPYSVLLLVNTLRGASIETLFNLSDSSKEEKS